MSYQDGDLTGPYYPAGHESEYPCYTSPEAALNDDAIVFVNGIRNTLKNHIDSAQLTADRENAVAVGVYNESDISKIDRATKHIGMLGSLIAQAAGTVGDLLQSLSDDEGDFLHNPAITTLLHIIEKHPNQKIIGHSQGSLIVLAALRKLKNQKGGSDKQLGGYNIKLFGSPAATRPLGPNVEVDTANNDDAVSSFGMDALSAIRYTRNLYARTRMNAWLTRHGGLSVREFGTDEISRYNHRILTDDYGLLLGPHDYRDYENRPDSFRDYKNYAGKQNSLYTPNMESTTWPATFKALTGYNATKTFGKWLGEKAHNIGHEADQWMFQHRAEISETLHEASDLFGVMGAATGVAAAGLALSVAGMPFAPGMGVASLAFAAASAASRAWYSTSLAVGTLDGSVSVGAARAEAKGAAIDTALVMFTGGVGKTEELAGTARKIAEGKSAIPVAAEKAGAIKVGSTKALSSFQKIAATIQRLKSLPLRNLVQNAALAKRLKWLTGTLKAVDFVNSVIGLVTSPLAAAANTVVAAGQFVVGKGKEAGQWAAQKAQQIGGFAQNIGAKAGGAIGLLFGSFSHGLHLHRKALPGGPVETDGAEQAARRQEQTVAEPQSGSMFSSLSGLLMMGLSHLIPGGAALVPATSIPPPPNASSAIHPPSAPPALAASLPAAGPHSRPHHGTTKGFLERQAQYQSVMAAARNAGDAHPEVTAAQWALESGWGRRQSGKNNFFGIKSTNNTGTLVPTHEVVGGKRVAVNARFADYQSFKDGIAAHSQFLGGRRYARVGYGTAKTPAEAIDALVKGHYATDPHYADKLLPMIRRYAPEAETAPTPSPAPSGNGLEPVTVLPMRLGALQRKGTGDHPDVHPAALRADLRKQSTGFVPDSNVRAKLGGHLGFDPGGARLHTGPAAASASRRLNAEAFTIGNDVFFGDGRFDPHTPKGLGLIAHELTHVGQQTGTTGNKARFFTAQGGDEMEREAQQTGERVLANAGCRAGFFVEDYVREYEGEYNLSQSDQQRLDRISVKALEESQRMLERQGLRGLHADALDVQVEIDLSEMSDGEAVRVWAEAICIQISNSQKAMSNSQPNSSLVQRTANDGQSALAEPTFLGTLWDSVKSGEVEEQIGAFVKGFGTGVISGIEGLYTLVRHPIKSAKGLYHMVVHYDETKATLKALVDEYVAAAETDPIKFARMTGELTGQIEVALITPGKVIQGGKSIAEFLTPASETLGKVGTAAKFDPLVSSLPKQLSKLTNAELESTARLPDEVGAFAGERLLSFTTKKMFLVRVGPFGRYGADLFDSLEEAQAYADRLSVLDAEAIRDKFALLTEWNKVDAVRIFEVPSGTPYLGGEIAAQVEKGSGILYHGGGYQVAIGPEQKLNQVGDAIAITGTSPTTPVGSMRNPLRVVPGSEAARNIGNRYFTGPALEGMHSNGIPSTVVEDAIATGQQEAGSLPGTTRYYQPTNNVSVVVDTKTQNVVEVHPGIASNSNLKLNRSTLAGHDPDTGAAEQEAQITEASVTKDINRKYSSSNAIGQTRQGMGIGLIQRKVISLKSPFGSLQNFVSSHSGRPNLTTPSIDVRATHIGGSGIVGALLSRMPIWHLFIVTTNEAGQQRFYRGGPGGPGKGPYGTIKSTHGPYVPGTVDWNPSAPSKTVSKGNDAKNKDSVLTSELQRIDGLGVNYEPLGPNSNTVASTLLRKCDIPRLKPVWLAPGWNKPDL